MNASDGKIQPYRVIVDPREPMKYTSPTFRRKHIADEDKKKQHRLNERFRHHNLNLAIKEIIKAIPYPHGQPPKNETKYNVLHRASAYMEYLKTKISVLSHELDMQSDFVEGLAVFDKPFNAIRGGKKCSVPAFSPLSDEDVEGLLGHKLPPIIPIYKPKPISTMANDLGYDYNGIASADFSYAPIMCPNVPSGFVTPESIPLPVMVSTSGNTPYVLKVPSLTNTYITSSTSEGKQENKTHGRQITAAHDNRHTTSSGGWHSAICYIAPDSYTSFDDLPAMPYDAHSESGNVQTNLPTSELKAVEQQAGRGQINSVNISGVDHLSNSTEGSPPGCSTNVNSVSDSSSPTSSTCSQATTVPSSDFLSGSSSTQISDDSLMAISQEDQISLMSDDILPSSEMSDRKFSGDSSTFSDDQNNGVLTQADVLTAVTALGIDITEEATGVIADVDNLSVEDQYTNANDNSFEAVSPDEVIEMSVTSSVFEQNPESDEEEFLQFMENVNDPKLDILSMHDSIAMIPLYGVGVNVPLPMNIEDVLTLIHGPQDLRSVEPDQNILATSSTSSPYKSSGKRSWINGYQLFTKINHHKFRSSWPSIQGREITRLLGKAWKDFPTEFKTLYSQRACDLNEYNRMLSQGTNATET